MSKSFSETFNYKPLKDYSGLMGRHKLASGNTYIGIEVEAEKVNRSDSFPPSWVLTEDGSLKIRGAEFYTVPIKLKYLEIELSRLFTRLKDADFSSRTSIHVHVNARDFTLRELHSFLLLYCLYERSLFLMSGNRRDSNFCVPIFDCLYHMEKAGTLLKCITEVNDNPELIMSVPWSKYLALNLLPLYGGDGVTRHGTIEFRHMKGNNNIPFILNWCNVIVRLKKTAKLISPSDLYKRVLAKDETLIAETFGDWVKVINVQDSDFQSGLRVVKYLQTNRY